MRKRLGRLEDNEREDYGSRKELAQAITNIGTTLIQVSDSLTNLNKKSEHIDNKIDNLESKMNLKIDDLEDQIYNQKIEDVKQIADIELKDVKNHSVDLIPIKNKVLYILLGLGVLYITLDKTGVISKLLGIG